MLTTSNWQYLAHSVPLNGHDGDFMQFQTQWTHQTYERATMQTINATSRKCLKLFKMFGVFFYLLFVAFAGQLLILNSVSHLIKPFFMLGCLDSTPFPISNATPAKRLSTVTRNRLTETDRENGFISMRIQSISWNDAETSDEVCLMCEVNKMVIKQSNRAIQAHLFANGWIIKVLGHYESTTRKKRT